MSVKKNPSMLAKCQTSEVLGKKTDEIVYNKSTIASTSFSIKFSES